jgi:hypothetical protein
LPRPIDPEAQYRVKPHNNNGYTYASTQPPYIDPKTGKKKYRYIHWGTIDSNLKFAPSTQFFLATPEERSQLIFPEEWDMSEVKKLTSMRNAGRASYDEEEQNRLYGDIFGARPDGMAVDSDARVYYKQYEIDYEVKSIEKSAKRTDRLKLNLYFDPIRRGLELMELDIALSFQSSSLDEFLQSKSAFTNVTAIKRDYCYYNIDYDPSTLVIKSFVLNEKKVEKTRRLSGFFAIMTHGVDFSAMEAFHTYSLRDEQEKYFQQMKSQMVADRQRNWSEKGKTGRLFILFVSLILSSWVRYI